MDLRLRQRTARDELVRLVQPAALGEGQCQKRCPEAVGSEVVGVTEGQLGLGEPAAFELDPATKLHRLRVADRLAARTGLRDKPVRGRLGGVEPARADEARDDRGRREVVGELIPPRAARSTRSAARACPSAVSVELIIAPVASTQRSPFVAPDNPAARAASRTGSSPPIVASMRTQSATCACRSSHVSRSS